MKIAVNGRIVAAEEAVVSVYDHGFLYGMGLFETFRTYRGRPFLLEAHGKRLESGCRILGIDYRFSSSRIMACIAELLQTNALDDAYIRLSVSAGVHELGLPAEPYDQPNEFVYVKPLPSRQRKTATRDLQKLKTPRNLPEGDVRLKSFHYMNNILGKREMDGYPWCHGAEGLFLTRGGHLAEGIVSNLFFVWGGVVFTPSVDTGILPGVTRDFVMKLAGRLGREVREGRYTWEDLKRAEEIFLTNSIQEIVPVARLYDDNGTIAWNGPADPGPLTRQLIEQYQAATTEGGSL